ncbi:hypothetical protein MC04F13_28240 [Escherichia coli]
MSLSADGEVGEKVLSRNAITQARRRVAPRLWNGSFIRRHRSGEQNITPKIAGVYYSPLSCTGDTG